MIDTDIGYKEERPWGSFEVLQVATTYRVKELIIHPNARLSYQYHHHRSERWIVVAGILHAIVDDNEVDIMLGETLFISIGVKHRIVNQDTHDIKIIEVWMGDDLRESDIVRVSDDYGRAR